MTYKILLSFFFFLLKISVSSETKKQVQSPVRQSNNYFCRRSICSGLQTNDLALPSREGFMEALRFSKLKEKRTSDVLTVSFSCPLTWLGYWLRFKYSFIQFFSDDRLLGDEYCMGFKYRSFKTVGFYATEKYIRRQAQDFS
jgi:hypothetical protein